MHRLRRLLAALGRFGRAAAFHTRLPARPAGLGRAEPNTRSFGGFDGRPEGRRRRPPV